MFWFFRQTVECFDYVVVSLRLCGVGELEGSLLRNNGTQGTIAHLLLYRGIEGLHFWRFPGPRMFVSKFCR